MLSELDYVTMNFPDRFAKFTGKRAVLHGTREYAVSIIDHFQNRFQFVGIMTRDSVDGHEFHGLPILDEADLTDLNIDLVILTERVKYAEAVYQDIYRKCDSSGISLYNMYGVDEISAHREYKEINPLNIYGWQKLCGNYPIVMFETVGGLFHEPDSSGKLNLRKFLYRVIMWMLDQGIDVKFMLRKSIPEDLQLEALENVNFFPDLRGHIVRREGEDLSFRWVSEQNPEKKILYISESGIINEWLLPRCYGIDTYRSGAYIEEPFFDCFAPVGKPSESVEQNAEISRDKIMERINANDVISFDIFDTLLLRKTLYPEDVFDLVERRALQKGISAESFAEYRRKAVMAVPYAGIEEIYQWVEENSGMDRSALQTIQRLEFETENDVIIPRKEIVELLNESVKAGKKVVLTSDMYWSEAALGQLLANNGITGWAQIFVSCDYGEAKQNGLFGEICRCYGEQKILHIGDNPAADGISCAPYGIESVIIPSALALAEARGWADSIHSAQSWFDRCLLGMTVAELFRDPFQPEEIAELPLDDRLSRFSDSVVGPIAVGFLTYLMNKLRRRNDDGVLFVSRDCWLFYKIYEWLRPRYGLPRAHYLYANRHAAFLTCMDSPELAYFAIEGAKYDHLTYAETLTRIYGLPESALLEEIPGEPMEAYIDRHHSKIGNRVKQARSGYQKYFERCGIQSDENCVLVDFIAKGTTQAFLEKGLGCRFQGMYFGNYFPFNLNYMIEDYLITQKSLILQNYIELESFVTSPEPAVHSISENGDIIFDEEIRSAEELRQLDLVLNEAERFALDYFDLFYAGYGQISPDLIDEMFAAEGCHWVQQRPFNSWTGKPISTREWREKESADHSGSNGECDETD